MNIPIVKNFVESLHSHVLDLCSKNKHRLVRRKHIARKANVCLRLLGDVSVDDLSVVSQSAASISQPLEQIHVALLGKFTWRSEISARLARIVVSIDLVKRFEGTQRARSSIFQGLHGSIQRRKCQNDQSTFDLHCQQFISEKFQSIDAERHSVEYFRQNHSFYFSSKEDATKTKDELRLSFKEKLDFAMREIIFDLLSVGRCRTLTPEVNRRENRFSNCSRVFL